MLTKHYRIFAEVRLWTRQIPSRNPTFCKKFWHFIHTKNVTELTIHSSGYDWYKTILTVFYLNPKQLPAEGYVVFIRNFDDSFGKNCRTISSTDTYTVHNFTYLINYAHTFYIIFSSTKILKKTWTQNTIKRLTSACLLCSRPHATNSSLKFDYGYSECQRSPILF